MDFWMIVNANWTDRQQHDLVTLAKIMDIPLIMQPQYRNSFILAFNEYMFKNHEC